MLSTMTNLYEVFWAPDNSLRHFRKLYFININIVAVKSCIWSSTQK